VQSDGSGGSATFRNWRATAISATPAVIWAGATPICLAGILDLSPDDWILWISAITAVMAAARSARVRVEVRPDCLRVFNYFRSWSIRPEDVTQVEPGHMYLGVLGPAGYHRVLTVRRGDARTVPLQVTVSMPSRQRVRLQQAIEHAMHPRELCRIQPPCTRSTTDDQHLSRAVGCRFGSGFCRVTSAFVTSGVGAPRGAYRDAYRRADRGPGALSFGRRPSAEPKARRGSN
jgi:hypothetical protein